MIRNDTLLKKAEALKPELLVTSQELLGEDRVLKAGDEAIYDFGNHFTGYVTVTFEPAGRHQDAPLYFSVQFYEHPEECKEKPERYHGWISSSWIQREEIHIDILPCAYRFPRRYAFRYVKFKILSVSSNFSVKIKRISLDAVSSADDAKLLPFSGKDTDARMDEVSIRTLHECMQEVFEDGPKRDRRLWLGDLRLQALANYQTYRNYDLVKRCLYLFAGDTLEKGLLSNNIFLYPDVECDEQYMFDYSLFYISTLWDYYEASEDWEALVELEPVAYHQYELLRGSFDERGLVNLKKAGPCFVDWKKGLDKHTAIQGIYIYTLKDLVKIERQLDQDTAALEAEIQEKTAAAKRYLFSQKKGLYVSGPLRQLSYASQVWMVLAGVSNGEEAAHILENIEDCPRAVKMATPYMVHHYIQALINCGEKQKAYEKMTDYWGGMLEKGADTFWEVYDPDDPKSSPYGGKIVHSYCHAWSCTPTYFLRKYFSK